MKNMNLNAKLFIGAMAVAGVAALMGGLMRWECSDPVRFLSFLTMAAIASRLKVKLPGTSSNMSVNLPFILIALTQLSFCEMVGIAAVCAFVQCLPTNGQGMKPVQALFNVSTMLAAVAVSKQVYTFSTDIPSLAAKSLLISLAGAAFLLADTLPVATVISLTENLKLTRVWSEMLELTFSYFVLSAGVAAVSATASRYIGWQTPLLVLPAMIGAYISYKRYFRLPVVVATANLQFATLPPRAREKAEQYR